MTLVITLRGETDRDFLVDHPPDATVKELREALAALTRGDLPVLFSGAEAIPDSQPLGRGCVRHGSLVQTVPDHSPSGFSTGETPVVAVTSGPGAGRQTALRANTSLGRDSGCTLVLPDPTASRDHAVVRPLTGDASAAGPDQPVAVVRAVSGAVASGHTRGSREEVTLALDDAFRLGDTVLEVRHTRAVSHGEQPPVMAVEPAAAALGTRARLRGPVPVEHPRSATIPVSSLVSALVLGAGWALVLGARGALLAVLSALSLVIALGVETLIRAVRRRRRRRSQAEREARQHEVEMRHAALTGRDVRAAHPDAAALLASLQRHAPKQDHAPTDLETLRVRIGSYQEPTGWDDERGGESPAAYEVPAVVDLRASPELRISGPLSRRRSVAGWVVTQLAALHWKSHVTLLISEEASRTLGARWTRLLASGSPEEETATAPGVTTVRVEVDAPPTGTGSIVIRLEPGPIPVRSATRPAARPSSQGHALVTCARGARAVGTISAPPGAHSRTVALDLPDTEFFEQAARLLCPDHYRGCAPSWEELLRTSLGTAPIVPEEVDRTWDSPRRGCRAVLGSDESGSPWVLDLAEAGPHILVGGTTGSGKSQFLRTLVLSLCAIHPPDVLQLALLDFKGGAAFADLAQLPHVRQVATDLDEDWAHLALASLAEEVRRREQILADSGASSYKDLPPRAVRPAMSRLVVIIDEYSTLRDSHPGLLDGFVDLARRGRSLGLHLVLATQRPGGSVSREISANVGVRIAFRTASPEDSSEIVGAPDAAHLPAQAAGSAVVREGGGPLRKVRASLITRSPVRVTVKPWSWDGNAVAGLGQPAGQAPTGSDDVPGDGELIDAIREVAARRGMTAAPQLWADPLPPTVALDDLVAEPGPTRASPYGRSDQGDRWNLPVGLRRPLSGSAQDTYRLPIGPGSHVALFGAATSGRTCALRVTAAAALRTYGTDLELYVLDLSGDASDLEHLLTCRAYVGPNEPERTHQVLEFLSARGRAAMQERSSALGSVLLVDGWDVLMQQHAGTPLPEMLTTALRHGRRSRLGAVLTCGQAPLTATLASVVGHRLVLPLRDGIAYAAQGLPSSRATRHVHPGRALVVGSSDEVQFASTDPHTRGENDRHAESMEPAVDPLARARPDPQMARVPWCVTIADLTGPGTSHTTDPSSVILGAAGAGRPIRVNLGHPGRPILVTGPRRSGRTHTLGLIEHQLRKHSVPVLRLSPSSPVEGGWSRLADLGETSPVVLIDDLDRLDGERAAAAAALLSAATSPAPVLVAAEVDSVARAFRSPLTDARQFTHVLVLAPRTARDLDPWGIRYPVYGPWPAGRGMWRTDGEATVVQVASDTA